MKKLYFVLTHYNADRAARFNIHLLSEYSGRFYRHGFEPHIIVLSTGTGLEPGHGEELFVSLPNLGHTDGDMEMINTGVTLALGRGAELIVKLSGNRIFLNPDKLIGMLDRLERSGKGMLGDRWIGRRDYATDIVFLKAWFAEKIVPIQVLGTPAICEARLQRRVARHGLDDQVLLYEERQPIHRADTGRRTSFYDHLEILSNVEEELETFVRRRYPQHAALLESGPIPIGPSTQNWVCRLRPAANPQLVLTRENDGFELRGAKGRTAAVLNDSAALVWSLCDGQRTVLDICANVESGLRLDEGDTFEEVRHIVARFISDGFLVIDDDPAD